VDAERTQPHKRLQHRVEGIVSSQDIATRQSQDATGATTVGGAGVTFPPPATVGATGRPVGGASSLGKDRSPAAVLGLAIITLGIYYLVWYYKINAEIRRHDPDIKVSPGLAVFAMFIPIANWVGAYSTAARIRQMQLDHGATQTISPVVALLLFMFLGIGYPLYIASQLREHWHGHRRTARPPSQVGG
jgi:drug/metabolite transporter (DMT)-like permease